MTGFAKGEKGLYYLTNHPLKKGHLFDEKLVFQCNVVNLHTWHNRLRHFPINKMHHLHKIQYSSFDNEQVCDVCYMAKHKRSVFPTSVSSTSACFELLHTHIWSPFHVFSMNEDFYF